MDKLHFFDKIPAKIPADQIYARLGYEQGITQISSKQKKEVDGYIDQARGLLKLQALARRINIKSKTDSELELSDTVTFESKLVASVFKDCQELLLMAATAGWEIIKAISSSKETNLTRGVVFDAVASETVDSCFDWLKRYFNLELKRENKQLISKRISCGYGDFSLENQRLIDRFLNLDKIGVSLNEKYMLIPEKSVTAITGVVEKS